MINKYLRNLSILYVKFNWVRLLAPSVRVRVSLNCADAGGGEPQVSRRLCRRLVSQ